VDYVKNEIIEDKLQEGFLQTPFFAPTLTLKQGT